jgi:transposase-like protein
MATEPTTLQEAVVYFASPYNCREYVVPRRWPDGVVCPTCGGDKVKFQPQHNRWQCSARHSRRQFTLKTGTVMEDSPIGLDKWLTAMWLVASNRNGVSSWELHRALGVTQKTAWFLLHRVRLAMQDEKTGGKLSGTIESDETYVGGKAANMHLDKLTRLKMQGHVRAGTDGKAIVMGLLERHGNARVKVLPNVRAFHIRTSEIENVEKGSTVYSDSLRSYRNLPVDGFIHDFVDHSEQYVKGAVHTNGMENFWSLFKRTIKGTYVSIEPFHLQAYADEQAFRFNNRLPMGDADRFSYLVRKIVGKRLTYAELTGKTEQASALGKNRPFPLTKSDPHEEHDLPLGKKNNERYHPRRRRAVCRSIIRAAGA